MFCFTCRSPPKFLDHHFSGVTGVTGVTRINSQRTLTFLRNTKVTPNKLFDPSGVAPMFTAVVDRPMLVYDVYVLRYLCGEGGHNAFQSWPHLFLPGVQR